MAADFRRVFGDRFVALVAGDHGGAAAFVTEIQAADLDALGALADTWRRDRLATPLVMTRDEFHRSLDTFPAEYQALLDHHVVIAGRAPFDDVRINPADLRRAARRAGTDSPAPGWIEAAAHHHGLAALSAVRRSAATRLSNLRIAWRTARDDAALAAFARRSTAC
jgi:hypothetical protein